MLRLPQSGLSKTAIVLSALACTLAGPAALAQATLNSPITADSQVSFTVSGTNTSFSGPRGVAISAATGDIYVADQTNKRVVKIVPTTNTVTSTTGTIPANGTPLVYTPVSGTITLSAPTAVAVDIDGNVFIADAGNHQLIKWTATTSSKLVYNPATGAVLNPVALATDPVSGTLYVADSGTHAVYKVALGATSGTPLTIYSPATGVNPDPVGLTVDGSGDLFIADGNAYASGGDRVYEHSAAGVNTDYLAIPTSNTYTLKFSSATKLPIGMGFDPAGNLYVMDSGASTEHLIEAQTGTYYFLVPFSSAGPTGMAIGPVGNIIFADDTNNLVDKLYYNNPLIFSNVDANKTTSSITANFQFNTAATSTPVQYQNVQGDYTGEFTQTGGSTTCSGGDIGTTCTVTYAATYQPATPGLRQGAFGFSDNSPTNNLMTVLVNATNIAGSLALYPGTQTLLTPPSTSFYEPQGLAVTGGVNAGGVNDNSTNAFSGNLFVADEGGDFSTSTPTYKHGAVYQYTVATGTIATPKTIGSFPTPMAVLLDAEGDLFVADYSGFVYVIQPTLTTSTSHGNTTRTMSWNSVTSKALTLPKGVALNHPMALALDPSGDLFIGDTGSLGSSATVGTPGYVIEVPNGPLSCGSTSCTIGGAPAFQLTNLSITTSTGSTPIVFPQSLVTDATGNLFIADGGDIDGVDPGGVDVIPASGAAAYQLSLGSLDQPTGLNFDAANDLYVVDSYNQRILVAQLTTGSAPALTGQVALLGTNQSGDGTSGITSTLITPSTMVVWPGGQNISVADIGLGSDGGSSTTYPVQIVDLQALNSTVAADINESTSVYGVNVGNTEITFEGPNYSGSTYCDGLDTIFGCTGPSGNSFSLAGCGSQGSTVYPGIVAPNAEGTSETCTATITHSRYGATNDQGIFQLVGNATSDYSTLLNLITVNGSSSGGTPNLNVSPTFSLTTNGSGTLTVTNNGTGDLVISNIQIEGATQIGGTCAINTSLEANLSCTIKYEITINRDGLSIGIFLISSNASNGAQYALSFYCPECGGGFADLEKPVTDQQDKLEIPALSSAQSNGGKVSNTGQSKQSNVHADHTNFHRQF